MEDGVLQGLTSGHAIKYCLQPGLLTASKGLSSFDKVRRLGMTRSPCSTAPRCGLVITPRRSRPPKPSNTFTAACRWARVQAATGYHRR